MARITIKESVIRNYVRSLIRESIEAEAVEDPRDLEEREKMLAGKSYNRTFFPDGGKSLSLERQRRAQLGLPPLRKPMGGVKPILIDGNGNDITPENSPEAIQARIEGRVKDHAQKMAKRFVKKADRENLGKVRGLSDKEAANLKIDKYANDVESDPYTQRMLSMSPEERAKEADRIRRDRIARGRASNAVISKMVSDLGRRGLGYPTKEELLQHIERLKVEQKELGPRCPANEDGWKRYDYLIKDACNILNKYYNNKDASSDVADEIVNDALNDIDNDERFRQYGHAQMGDDYVDSSNIATNVPEDDFEPLDYEEKDKFDELGDMGLFDDDDDNSFKFSS